MSSHLMQAPAASAALRRVMVDRQVRTFDVTDARVLAAMEDVPRELFLPENLRPLAYSDASLSVPRSSGQARRLLAPMILARMMQAAEIAAKDRCLNVAGGGGYAAALLARLSVESIALEDDEALAEQARKGFAAAGLTNASAVTGTLSDARGVEGSFEVIVLEAAVEAAPTGLLARLADGGRLVAIRSESENLAQGAAQATLWTRSGDRFGRTPLFNAWAPVLPEFAKPPSFVFPS